MFFCTEGLYREIKKMTEEGFWDKFNKKHNSKYYYATKKIKKN